MVGRVVLGRLTADRKGNIERATVEGGSTTPTQNLRVRASTWIGTRKG